MLEEPLAAERSLTSGLLRRRGAAGGRTVANVRIVASKWTWDAGPYAGDNVLTVFDLYMDLLEKKVLPEAERLISRTAPPP